MDEAGRGAIFGPLVVAAVVFKEGTVPRGVKDSKKLSPKKREELFLKINQTALDISISIASNFFIDETNIHYADIKAMRDAILKLKVKPDIVYIDGYSVAGTPYKIIAMKKADSKIPEVSAASIVAKVVRDHIVLKFSKFFPEYQLEFHKGYATIRHKDNIVKNGLTVFHRLSFRVV